MKGFIDIDKFVSKLGKQKGIVINPGTREETLYEDFMLDVRAEVLGE